MKKKSAFLFFFLTLLAIAAITGYRIYLKYLPVSYRTEAYAESTELLAYPYCGFYEVYGRTLSEEPTETITDWADSILEKTDCKLFLLQLNLKNYSSKDLSNNALAQMEEMFHLFSSDGQKLILRFLYDWDNEASLTEPADIDRIKQHMTQVSDIVNAHKEDILVIQGISTGNYGEMNNTRFGDRESVTSLMTHLASVIDPSIFLSVRTPTQLRSITETFEPISASESFTGTLTARIGLYNDGMLGSVFDLGTYDDTPWEENCDPWTTGVREEEIGFQNTLCNYVPNGGEAVLDNPYNDLENAISDLTAMHVSYLNKNHDEKVIEKWRNSIYTGSNVWNGINGYDYIAAHLGYRYLITDSSLSFDTWHEDSAHLSLTIRNEGFSPSYREFTPRLYLQNTVTSQETELPISWDNRFLAGTSSESITIDLPVRTLAYGSYRIFLSLTDPNSEDPIPFANIGYSEEEGILIGTLHVDEPKLPFQ